LSRDTHPLPISNTMRPRFFVSSRKAAIRSY
jgi:hypothetical protein